MRSTIPTRPLRDRRAAAAVAPTALAAPQVKAAPLDASVLIGLRRQAIGPIQPDARSEAEQSEPDEHRREYECRSSRVRWQRELQSDHEQVDSCALDVGPACKLGGG